MKPTKPLKNTKNSLRRKIKARKISNMEFVRLIKNLRAEACLVQARLHVHSQKQNWDRVREGMESIGHARGYYRLNSRIAIITVYGRAPRWKILYVMAHELRHAQHHHNGLYKDYYRKDIRRLYNWARSSAKTPMPNIKLPCLKTAFLAERDCDKFAKKWLIANGIVSEAYDHKPFYVGTRGFYSTMAYYLVQSVKEKCGIQS